MSTTSQTDSAGKDAKASKENTMKLSKQDICWVFAVGGGIVIFLAFVDSGHDLSILLRNFWFELGMISLLVSLVTNRWNLPAKFICLAYCVAALTMAFLPFVIGSFANFFFVWFVSAIVTLLAGYAISVSDTSNNPAETANTLTQDAATQPSKPLA